jgi:hypothetical protein
MGIREIDLEPQFASGKILIPRISEYAGVLLIQALRGVRAKFRFGPSDTIFATQDTMADAHEAANKDQDQISQSLQVAHPAEDLPVSSEGLIPGLSHLKLIDTIVASATLKSSVVEAERSEEYHDLIDALQREVKYKAFRRGAHGIINFKIQLTALTSSPLHYRVLAMGSAVKSEPPGALPSPESSLGLEGTEGEESVWAASPEDIDLGDSLS